MVSFRVDENDLARLDALARQTSCSRAEVLRRSYYGLNVELRDAIREVCPAVERLAGQS